MFYDISLFLFQSQNGLILTKIVSKEIMNAIKISIPKWSYFNRYLMKWRIRLRRISIPKWSYFNAYLLIQALPASPFQSQNGLILTFPCTNPSVHLFHISIPKWSYFNYFYHIFYGNMKQFQSQNGLILTPNPYYAWNPRIDFNPKMVLF